MKRRKASKKTDCWLFSVIESADNAICMGDSCGTRHFNSIWETHHRRVPMCSKLGRDRDGKERGRGIRRGIQNDRGVHVNCLNHHPPTPSGEAVLDMIIDLWPWLVIGDRNSPDFCIPSGKRHSSILLWYKAEEFYKRQLWHDILY